MISGIDNLQSFSEAVGTHVVLDCKLISTVSYAQYRSPPPAKHIKTHFGFSSREKHINSTRKKVQSATQRKIHRKTAQFFENSTKLSTSSTGPLC
jgi:hypothetical protein